MLPANPLAISLAHKLLSNSVICTNLCADLGTTVNSSRELNMVVILSTEYPETYFEVLHNKSLIKQCHSLSVALTAYATILME